jgi:hypothetical protein
VTIRLPKLSTGQLLDIAALETDLPNFMHNIADLLGGVHFDSLSLRAANGHIFSQVSVIVCYPCAMEVADTLHRG